MCPAGLHFCGAQVSARCSVLAEELQPPAPMGRLQLFEEAPPIARRGVLICLLPGIATALPDAVMGSVPGR
jgi:hypothetical protein